MQIILIISVMIFGKAPFTLNDNKRQRIMTKAKNFLRILILLLIWGALSSNPALAGKKKKKELDPCDKTRPLFMPFPSSSGSWNIMDNMQLYENKDHVKGRGGDFYFGNFYMTMSSREAKVMNVLKTSDGKKDILLIENGGFDDEDVSKGEKWHPGYTCWLRIGK